MSQMIERVATDIRSKLVEFGINLNNIDVAPSIARAAIEAMREPTEAMATHPMATCYNYGPYGDKEVTRIWRSMIDAALSTPNTDKT